MAQIDTYLVEKLREILQRLHSNNKFNKFSHTLPNEKSGQEVIFKRYSTLSPFAPISQNQQNIGDEIEPSALHSTDKFENKESYDSTVEYDAVSPSPTRYYTAGHITYNTSFAHNYSDASYPYGVEVNCTAGSGDSSLNQTISNGKENDSADLTRSLHEFIHILKMSLKSGTAPFYSDLQGVFHSNTYRSQAKQFPGKYGVPHDSFNLGDPSSVGQNSSDTIWDAGIEAASKNTMNFNLTSDDILDVNSLLQEYDVSTGVPIKHVLIIVIYFMIACVSIIGNLLVIQLVIRSRRFHTLTHALLANLGASDLVLATINIPFSAARVIMTEWHFGPVLCRAVPFLQVTSVYATSFTMAVIAMDRYQVIMNPLGKRIKCSQGILLVIAIWLISGALSLPYALNQVVSTLTVRVVKRCQPEYDFQIRQLLTVATFLAQYLLPLVFTTVSYISIMKRLWYRSSGLGSTTPRQVAAQSRAKLKTIKMLVLTVIFFAVTWLPIHLYHLFTHFSHVRHNSTAILICHMIAMSSSMYNPFIFCGLNEHFRREAVKWLHCFRTRRSPVVHPGTEVNGMLARADQGPRRNMSSTVIHTTLSYRRSPQSQHHQQRFISPVLGGNRRGILATSNTTAAVYMNPRQCSTTTSTIPTRGSSPTISRLITNLDTSSRNGSTTSNGYQPELLFLVRDSVLSPTNNFEVEGGDSMEEDINAEDFLDSLGDEMSLSIDYRGRQGKIINQFVKDTNDADNNEEDNDDNSS